MNELEKVYEKIETWYYCAEQEGFAYENDILYLDYVKKYINNLQSKIDKANMFIDKYLEIVDNPDINMQCVKDILKKED